jgi:hypothetical protein
MIAAQLNCSVDAAASALSDYAAAEDRLVQAVALDVVNRRLDFSHAASSRRQ